MKELQNIEIEKKIIEKIGDRKINYFELAVLGTDESVLFGCVDSKELLEKVEMIVEELNKDIKISVSVMGEEIPAEYMFGMVKIPCCDIRSEPKFRSERSNQLIYGEWVKILKITDYYILVKELKNGYIGYINKNAIDFCSKKKMSEIKALPNYIVDKRFSFCEVALFVESCETNIGWIPLNSKLYVEKIDGDFLYSRTPQTTVKLSINDCVKVEQDLPINLLKKLVEYYYGVPYLWGGGSTFGIDCSGFVSRLYDQIGIMIPRDADQQEIYSEEVQMENIKFGDLIFFPGHVGMYFGNETMIHSNVALGGVTLSKIINPQTPYEKELVRTIRKIGRIKK